MLTTLRMSSLLALAVFFLPLPGYAQWGFAVVDATWLPSEGKMFNHLVSWDGSFLEHKDATKPAQTTTTYELWVPDGSVPGVSDEFTVLVNEAYATDMVRKILNSWPWSPTWPNGLPNPANPPMLFTLVIDSTKADPIHGGRYALAVQVREWSGITPPVSCTASTASISIGPVANDAIASSSASVNLRCNADTDYKMTVGSANGADLIPYTTGGRVRMSFDESAGPRPNIYAGHAIGNVPVQTNVRATTVPGTSLPGKYTASAVVSVEIL